MKITATGLGKRFNREWIFRNLNYTFESGNTYAVTGPNGCGKSTLLQILWGQMPASEGSVAYVDASGPIEPEVIFERVSIATPYMELVEEFTLSEIISFHFRFKKIRNDWPVTQVLREMELTHAADKQIFHFSSGMKQRLKLGLALFSDTPIVFLDEPTTNLDQKSVDWYTRLLNGLPAECLVIIASNQAHEYPLTARKIDILTYKGLHPAKKSD